MEFRVLGPVEVSEGGRLLDIGPRMPRAILAALLVEANRLVALERLIDWLWGSNPQPRPSALCTSTFRICAGRLSRPGTPVPPRRCW